VNRTRQPSQDFGSHLASGLGVAATVLLVVAAVGLPLVAGTASGDVLLLLLSLPMVGVFLWTLRLLFYNRIELPRGWAFIGGAAFLVVAILSGLRSDCPQAALVTVLTWLGYGAGLLLVLWIGADPRSNRALVAAVCAIAVAIAVLGIVQRVALLDLLRQQIERDPVGSLAQTGLSARDLPWLKQRTINKRVFGTYALPNSMAGLLLLAIPAAVAFTAGARRWRARAALLAGTLLMGVALWFTGSKGSGIAAAVIVGIVAVMHRRWAFQRPKLVFGGLAALLLAAGLTVGLSSAVRGKLSAAADKLGASSRVRLDYWSAAIDMWQSRPITGVGPGNFQNHYLRHASILAEEVKHAHNDYLEILAELGPIGLAAYLLFWGGAVRRGTRAIEQPGIRPGWAPPPATAAIVGTFTILALAMWRHPLVGTKPWHEIALTVTFVVVWIAFHLAATREPRSEQGPSPALRVALALGLIGFLLHTVVDFDFYVEGVGFIAVVLAGLLLAPVARMRRIELTPARRLAGVLGVGIGGVLLFCVVMAVVMAEGQLSLAQALRRRAREFERDARSLGRSDPTEARQVRLLAMQYREECGEVLGDAAAVNPLDHRIHAERATWLTEQISRRGRDPADAIEAWRRAIHLNPSFPDYRAHFGGLLIELAKRLPLALESRLPRYEPLARTYGVPVPGRKAFLPAIVQAHALVDLAPYKARYWILYGDALNAAGLTREARKRYTRALDLNRRLVEGGGPKRQRLTEDELEYVERQMEGQ
jgi:O-antigen ligase/tetratricopeptide (TPR) repeat protein